MLLCDSDRQYPHVDLQYRPYSTQRFVLSIWTYSQPRETVKEPTRTGNDSESLHW